MTATECADTCKAAAPGGACRDGIRQHAGARSRVAPRLCNSVHLLYWVAPIRGSRTLV
nr:MAG TPA: hypothetical protein [Caudoviricetes sp.]DAM43898.1 MAG TPA: hypothetical protein [Caudoviricetes sp.]